MIRVARFMGASRDRDGAGQSECEKNGFGVHNIRWVYAVQFVSCVAIAIPGTRMN